MTKALQGKTIIVTRAAEQAAEFIALLEDSCARVVHIPSIKFVPPDSWDECDGAIASLADYDWLVLTSTNGVSFFTRRLLEKGKQLSDLKNLSIAAVGPGTEAALQQLGLEVDVVPETFRGEGLVAAFQKTGLKEHRVLLLKPQKSRAVLHDGLADLGARVTAVSVYKTLPVSAAETQSDLRKLNGDTIDVLTFTSPSTVRSFMNLCGEEKVHGWVDRGCKVAAIGGVTEAALAGYDLPVSIQPERSTIPDLVKEIGEYFSCKQNSKTTC